MASARSRALLDPLSELSLWPLAPAPRQVRRKRTGRSSEPPCRGTCSGRACVRATDGRCRYECWLDRAPTRRVSSSQLAWKEPRKRVPVRAWRSRLWQPTLTGHRPMDVGSRVCIYRGSQAREARIGVAIPRCVYSCTSGTYRPAILFRAVDCIQEC